MRVVAWNIRAGGGRRADGIVEQLRRWRADVVVLSEFRGTGPSRQIAARLAQLGLFHQRDTVTPVEPARNALLVASRWPLRRAHAHQHGREPQRWLRVTVAAEQPFALLGVHVPNRHTGRKYPFLQALSGTVESWRGSPGIVIGDTNSGRRGLDEERPVFNRVEDDWLAGMDALGWRDAFRARYPRRREYTWYSPNGNNGFRLDQAFLHPRLERSLTRIRHDWGRLRLSDHAALVLDLDRH